MFYYLTYTNLFKLFLSVSIMEKNLNIIIISSLYYNQYFLQIIHDSEINDAILMLIN